MNIGIDARGMHGNKAGIPIYIEELVKRISADDKKNKYILYSNKDIEINAELGENVVIKKVDTKNLGSIWLHFELPKMLQEDKIDVFWGTQHCLPKRNKHTKNMKFVLTIHDVAIKKLKTVGSLKNTIVQKLFLGRSIKLADKIIAISEATKADIIEFYKIDENKIRVIYNGTNIEKAQDLSEEEEKQIREKFNIENTPFVFFISTIEPRKNVPTLIKAFNYIKDKENTDLKLILAGGLGWKYGDVLELHDASKYKDDIIMPGYISKQEKKYLFENTKCFVYPSLYEGFGLPILEAMANNALVVTANNSSLPEVGGTAALYFDNILDEKELGEKILEAINLSKEEKTKRIEQGLAQAQKFTWEDCANKTIAILEE